MPRDDKVLDENRMHLIFQVSLFLKGAFAIFEMVGGIIAYVVPHGLL